MSTKNNPGDLLDGGFKKKFLIGAFVTFLMAAQATTQMAASGLIANGYRRALGEPLLSVLGFSWYQPFAFVKWTLAAGATKNPAIEAPLDKGLALFYAWLLALMAVSLGLAIFGKRKPIDDEQHGSARWATQKDVEETGLLDMRLED